MFKITALVALTVSFASAQFLNVRDLQAAAATTSPTGGTWMNGTCARAAGATTDACVSGTCCVPVYVNGTLSTQLTASTGVCVPVGFAGTNTAISGTNWTLGSCLLSTSVGAYNANWNTNQSACNATTSCWASITWTLGGVQSNQSATNACYNKSSTPVNVQWYTYPNTSALVYPVQVDAKTIATCPAAASNATTGNATTGNTTTGTSSGVFVKASVALVAVFGALYF